MAKIALLIGVSDYTSGLCPLPSTQEDIEAMQRVLQDAERGGFDDIENLSNPERQTMEEKIESLFSGRKKDDLVLLYFAGHGVKDEKGGLYLATHNTRKTERGEIVKSTAVSAGFVHDIMNSSRSRHQVVILDCCFSGAFAEGMLARDDGSVDVKNQLGGEGRVVLTSSTSTQYSFEQKESEPSVYTRYLVEGIETGAADEDGDGWISVEELHEYAKQKVQEAEPAMKPEIYIVKEGFKILLAKAPMEPHQDWGEAPDVPVFFGRAKELATLEQWIVKDRCRLVAIVGMLGTGKTRLLIRLGKGGIGKTDLSLKLARGIQNEFEFVTWQSLLNAPPVTKILADLIKFLSDQQEIYLPDTVDAQISKLLHYLQKHRCLVILDNVEAMLQGEDRAGQYREGYEGYGNLFKRVGEVPHQSCLLLTSREKPREIARLEGKNKPVRSLELSGLNEVDGRKIFEETGAFFGSDEEWRNLIEFYNGNPLALELAAKHIEQVFFGDISEFWREGKPVFGDLWDLLNWHFGRLSDSEKEIMYWLAINREPVSPSELKRDILSQAARDQVPTTLQLLQRQLPLERSGRGFTLQPVLIEYMTGRFIEQVGKEIKT